MRISDWSSDVCSSDLAGRSDQSISKRDAMSTNAALKPSASSSRNRATTRMKKVSVSGSSNCWASRILAPNENSAVLTEETIPGRSGHDNLREYSSVTPYSYNCYSLALPFGGRSEDRRVGKEGVSQGRFGWWTHL